MSNLSRLKYLSLSLLTKDLKVLAVPPVLLDPQVHLVPLALPAQPVPLDRKVTQAHRVPLAPLGLLVPQAL